jgi:tetratricopeptide (TPR) repeat protein
MERKIVIILMLPFLLSWHWFEPAAKKNHDGIKAYQEGKYDEALEKFLNAKGINADLAELKNNTASSLYQKEKYKKALKEFLSIGGHIFENDSTILSFEKYNYTPYGKPTSTELIAKKVPLYNRGDTPGAEKLQIPKDQFYYNLGNTLYKLEKYDKALESYKQSLIANPDDMDAKKNYELTLKKIKEQKDKEKQDKKQDKDQEKEKEKEKQQQDENKQQQDEEKQQQPQQQKEKEKKHQNIMQYLDQNEKKQMEKKKRKVVIVRKEKDW